MKLFLSLFLVLVSKCIQVEVCSDQHVPVQRGSLGQWLMLSWQSSCFQCQRSVARITSLANYHYQHIYCWKEENKENAIAPPFHLRLPYAAQGSNPMCTIYAFLICIIFERVKTKINEKEAHLKQRKQEARRAILKVIDYQNGIFLFRHLMWGQYKPQINLEIIG